MKILQNQPVLVEIGPLDATFRLPKRPGVDRRCDYCGLAIVDREFIAGIQKGRPNLRFHESCIPESERKDAMSL